MEKDKIFNSEPWLQRIIVKYAEFECEVNIEDVLLSKRQQRFLRVSITFSKP